MAYEHVEQLNDRKSEKVVLFLTLENLAGMLIVGGPIFVMSTAWALPLRVLAIALGVLIGVSLTFDRQGIPIYRRILWRGQGLVWRWTQAKPVTPAMLPRSRTPERGAPAAPRVPRTRMVRRLPGQMTAHPLVPPPAHAVAAVAVTGTAIPLNGQHARGGMTIPLNGQHDEADHADI